MTSNASPNFNLFFRVILQTLEAIGAPYMIIGTFAAMLYGATRTTYDIDIYRCASPITWHRCFTIVASD